jgi:3-deoxy-D-manno-octulosonic-acid transferase
LKKWFPEHILFSELSADRLSGRDVIIVNTIGHLSSLYRYGSIAYIGGGFGKGIHNILEATAAGMPVLFGPNFNRFREAIDLQSEGAAFVVESIEEGYLQLNKLLDKPNLVKEYAQISKNYTFRNRGATNRIVDFVFQDPD